MGTHYGGGLSTDPAAHIHVTVGRARTRRVHAETDSSPTFFAIPAAAAADVEGYRHHIAHFDVFHVSPGFDHFTSDLGAQNQAGGRRGAAPNQMLVSTANTRGNHYHYDTGIPLTRTAR